MNKILILITILIISLGNVFSQKDIILKGMVVDSITNEPIIFAHLYLQNISTGTFTNNDGYFELIIPKSEQNSFVRVSCIGYKTLNLKVSEIKTAKIVLAPKINYIDEVAIVANYDPKSILKKAYKLRKKNYQYEETYCSNAYYREYYAKDDETIEMLELIASYNSDGVRYNNSNKISYDIDSVNYFYRKDFEHIYSSLYINDMYWASCFEKHKKGFYNVDSVFFDSNNKLISITYIPPKSDTITFQLSNMETIEYNGDRYVVESTTKTEKIIAEKTYQYQNKEHFIIDLKTYAIINYSYNYQLIGEPLRFSLTINKFYSPIFYINVKFKKIGDKYFPLKFTRERKLIFVKKDNIDISDYKLNDFKEIYFKEINPNCEKHQETTQWLDLEEFLEEYKNIFYENAKIKLFNDSKRKEYLDKIKAKENPVLWIGKNK